MQFIKGTKDAGQREGDRKERREEKRERKKRRRTRDAKLGKSSGCEFRVESYA